MYWLIFEKSGSMVTRYLLHSANRTISSPIIVCRFFGNRVTCVVSTCQRSLKKISPPTGSLPRYIVDLSFGDFSRRPPEAKEWEACHAQRVEIQ